MTVQSPYFQPGSNPSAVVQNVNANQNPDTTQVNFAAGRHSDLLVSETHGRLYAAAARGNLFTGSGITTTGVAILAAGGTTSGLVLGNPAGSGVNLEVHRVRVAMLTATGVVGVLGLEYGANPVSTTYQTTITQMPIAASANTVNKARMWDAVTIVANTWLMALPQSILATTVVGNAGAFEFNTDGLLVIPPGIAVNLVATAS